jgi:hypothetical protein
MYFHCFRVWPVLTSLIFVPLCKGTHTVSKMEAPIRQIVSLNDMGTMRIMVTRGHLQLNMNCELGGGHAWWISHSQRFLSLVGVTVSIYEQKNQWRSDFRSNLEPSEWEFSDVPEDYLVSWIGNSKSTCSLWKSEENKTNATSNWYIYRQVLKFCNFLFLFFHDESCCHDVHARKMVRCVYIYLCVLVEGGGV